MSTHDIERVVGIQRDRTRWPACVRAGFSHAVRHQQRIARIGNQPAHLRCLVSRRDRAMATDPWHSYPNESRRTPKWLVPADHCIGYWADDDLLSGRPLE
jgi:hypothetical protein